MPTPKIARLHRVATVEHEEGEANPAAREMLTEVDLIVDLIGQRNRGWASHEAIDEHNEHAG